MLSKLKSRHIKEIDQRRHFLKSNQDGRRKKYPMVSVNEE
jgi:hypothetical protein